MTSLTPHNLTPHRLLGLLERPPQHAFGPALRGGSTEGAATAGDEVVAGELRGARGQRALALRAAPLAREAVAGGWGGDGGPGQPSGRRSARTSHPAHPQTLRVSTGWGRCGRRISGVGALGRRRRRGAGAAFERVGRLVDVVAVAEDAIRAVHIRAGDVVDVVVPEVVVVVADRRPAVCAASRPGAQ
jgi:hypothetical protein